MILLRKGVYRYEHMNNWSRFNEEELPDKSDFYSSLNMDEITDIDYSHAKKVFDKFSVKNLGEHHDLYLQSDTLLLADIFESFRNKCIEIYGLDPVYFLSAPGLALQACLRKTEVKLQLLTDVDVLLMIEEGIRGAICHSIHRHAKPNNKYMKDYDKNKKSSYIIYMDANNLYGYAMSQKLSVDGLEWIENLSVIDEYFIKNYDEDRDVRYIIKADIQYPKDFQSLHSDLPFLRQRMNVNRCKKLVYSFYDKNTMLTI